ncbi:hypothetical protein RDWZM_008719 [Blomia tropicalis]|uniref:DnaJ homolog subfamily C member 2 n=1 Tax=Blomia tropicalis TaxID=40697 RepID=A0A9Q0M4T5_BLOTA|nr:DnaJ (Hsp40), sub C, member 2 [Blomia tropicalis]KAJ6217562.1 hypothetical protein RDWZM_008719 [Blomia tropicalis]
MTSKDSSVIVYESRKTWMSNLLCKLGILSVDDIEEDCADETKENESNNISNGALNGNVTQPPLAKKVVFDDDDACDKYLKTLDPKNFKSQDHYKVLGLSSARFDATESDIKKSYRKIVLRHHPDKRGQQNVDLDLDYYSCITKAYELLSDPIKRRSYDSVDETFDDSIPNVTTYNKNHFFEIFPQVFERNERWSNKKAVPHLGDANSTYEEVNDFYNFWYDFDSWREYSYLDEEEKEKGENREERRYLEKQNKAARAQRKKEEMLRIRQLVDNAYQCDPRVLRFKEEEKKRRQEMKQAKQASIKAKKEEEERLQREKEERELALKKKQEDEEKQRKEGERKQKEAAKKKIRQEIKQVENIFKEKNYYTDDPTTRIEYMQELDKLCKIYSIDKLVVFRQTLQSFNSDDKRKNYFLSQVEELNKKLESERIETSNPATATASATNSTSSKKVWSYDDIQLLIKAVKLFPAGTTNRWNVIANFINDKTDSGVTRNHRDVLEKTKELQKSGESQGLKEEANKNAYKKLENQMTVNSKPATDKKQESNPSERYDAPASILEVNDTAWTNEEQQLLEQAMKTYPANLGVERWNMIAECIPNRSRADCIKRYKHLVELVKAKNAAKGKK